MNTFCYVYTFIHSTVKTYDVAQDSTIGQKKRKIEEVADTDESKPKKAKLIEPLSPTTPGDFSLHIRSMARRGSAVCVLWHGC